MSRRIKPGSSNGVGASMRIDRGGNWMSKVVPECPYLPPGRCFFLHPHAGDPKGYEVLLVT
jgi:hypothetical protein